MGYLYALVAAILFAANGSVSKMILASGISAAQLTFLRVATMTLIAGIVLAITHRSAFRVSKKSLATMAVLGVSGLAMLQWFYALAISALPVGIALLIQYLAVLFVALIARIFFAELVKKRLWVAIVCILVGLAIVAQIWASVLSPLGILFALLAASSYTIFFLVGERQLNTSTPMTTLFWSMAFATLFWLFFSGWWQIDLQLLANPTSLLGNLSQSSVPLFIPLAWNLLLGSFLPTLLSFQALKSLKATAAGIVASSEVVFAFLIAWLWLGEELNLTQIIGSAIVLMGIVLAQTARAHQVVDLDLAFGKQPDETIKQVKSRNSPNKEHE